MSTDSNAYYREQEGVEPSDLHIAIGYDAFKAGFHAGQEWGGNDLYLRNGRSDEQMLEEAWSAYTPPEDLCGH